MIDLHKFVRSLAEKERRERAAVVEEAKTWLRTPYHHQGHVKGAGVDCAFLLIEVYYACGLIPKIDPRPYPHDWHLHRDEERYLGWVKKYAAETEDPQPGDVALFKFGRCVSHGAIVIDWPLVIHSYLDQGCEYADASKNPLAPRLAGCWTLWHEPSTVP